MTVTRRDLLIGGITAGGVSLIMGGLLRHPDWLGSESPEVVASHERPQELAYLAPLVEPTGKWGPGQLFTFLNSMQDKHLDPYGQSLELPDFAEKPRPQKIAAIHKELLWQSSSIFTYPLRSAQDINYHDIVVWCSRRVGIPSNEARFTSTFDLEKQIIERLFMDAWDKMALDQRQELLDKIDPKREVDKAAVLGMSGAAALGALSTTVYLAGFEFYTTMSIVISTMASWFGVVLPFAVYTKASSTVSVLAGPIGWAIGAVLLAGAITAWAGSANVRKTTATVLQLHAMKAGALYGTGEI